MICLMLSADRFLTLIEDVWNGKKRGLPYRFPVGSVISKFSQLTKIGFVKSLDANQLLLPWMHATHSVSNVVKCVQH